MNKKVIIGIICAIIIIAIAVCAVVMNSRNTKTEGNNLGTENRNEGLGTDVNNDTAEKNNTSVGGGKTLVVYYSAQSHTKAVAEKIAKNLNADTFEIVPKDVYTSADLDWTNSNSRVSREHEDESLRNIELVKTEVDNWESYDTIIIGYPIWWGTAAWPVDTFVRENDFAEKTVVPFCTSASSGLGESGRILEREAESGNWFAGHRFSSNPTDTDIKNWTDSLR